MPPDHSQSQEFDLDRTDRLPIAEGATFAEDVADDAVRMDFVPVAKSVKAEVRRPAPAGMPSLADSVRSVEERVARRNADYEALSRAFERARSAETAAAARAQSLAAELLRVRALLESEKVRSRGMDQVLADKNAATEAARSLRESLAARDAQLSALQREHAHIVPTLEERSTAATQLRADLNRAQARCESLTERVKAGEEELGSARRELIAMKTQNEQSLRQADSMRVELALQITALENERVLLKAEGLKRDDQMEVLMAHLQEARSAAPPANEQLSDDSRALPAALERMPEAAPDPGAPPQVEWAAELVRVDGNLNTAHPLRRRTRIGRAPGCELVIKSSSVSRHHALLHVGTLEVVIEDLNSTNGVLVNGRKVLRQLLRDGDQVTIGDAQFRFGVKQAPRLTETPAPDPR